MIIRFDSKLWNQLLHSGTAGFLDIGLSPRFSFGLSLFFVGLGVFASEIVVFTRVALLYKLSKLYVPYELLAIHSLTWKGLIVVAVAIEAKIRKWLWCFFPTVLYGFGYSVWGFTASWDKQRVALTSFALRIVALLLKRIQNEKLVQTPLPIDLIRLVQEYLQDETIGFVWNPSKTTLSDNYFKFTPGGRNRVEAYLNVFDLSRD